MSSGHKTIVKSVRLDSTGDKKLEAIHSYYKEKSETVLSSNNMHHIHNWTYSNTMQVMINDTFDQLVHEGYIQPDYNSTSDIDSVRDKMNKK
jgi:hypothetical protein